MKPPPFLTIRERELLPYLASGANRSQIADHFGLSEETVKRHTRNILTKFKAKTIRDGLWDISEYVTYFGYPVPMYDLYAHSVKSHLIYDADSKVMVARHEHHFECISEQFSKSFFSVFDGDFKAETVKIDGVASPYSSYILGKKTFETTYAIPKKRGERFKRVAEVFFDTSQSVFNDSYSSIWSAYPAGKIEFSIDFFGARLPNKIWYEVQVNANAIIDPDVLWRCSKNSASLKIDNPKTDRVYLIRWSW